MRNFIEDLNDRHAQNQRVRRLFFIFEKMLDRDDFSAIIKRSRIFLFSVYSE